MTVNVNDVNDAPGDIADSRRNDNYPENGTGAVATFSATDPDMDDITWKVTGTDVDDCLRIDDDRPWRARIQYLRPTTKLPTDGNDDDSNTYEITVTATDDGTDMLEAMKAVMVKVTDVEERATIELIDASAGGCPSAYGNLEKCRRGRQRRTVDLVRYSRHVGRHTGQQHLHACREMTRMTGCVWE